MFVRTSIMEVEDKNRPGVILIKRVYLDEDGNPIPNEVVKKLKEEGEYNELPSDSDWA